MKKKAFFFIILILLHFYLFSEVRVPFELGEDGQILITVFDEKDQKYIFKFDTATTVNVLFSNGYEKIKVTFDFDIKDELKNYIQENYAYLSDEDLESMISEYLNASYNFKLGNLRKDNLSFNDTSFVYDSSLYDVIDKKVIDGIIGINFFKINNNILIDYNNKNIVIDGAVLVGSPVSMSKLEELNMYTIPIKINNIKQNAIIDTGAVYFFMRNEYKKSKKYSEKDLLFFIDEGIKSTPILEDKAVKLTIANTTINIIGHFPDANKYASTKSGYIIAQKVNLLGYDVFKNHKIQLNFENMEFRIE
ncbi:MAG: hypothetical protein IJ688_03200 [Treponema sp.]|nr:hypothetical protein [Treponema sp.]